MCATFARWAFQPQAVLQLSSDRSVRELIPVLDFCCKHSGTDHPSTLLKGHWAVPHTTVTNCGYRQVWSTSQGTLA